MCSHIQESKRVGKHHNQVEEVRFPIQLCHISALRQNLERFSKMDNVSVGGFKYQLFGILGKGGYSCVYRFFSILINIPHPKTLNIQRNEPGSK